MASLSPPASRQATPKAMMQEMEKLKQQLAQQQQNSNRFSDVSMEDVDAFAAGLDLPGQQQQHQQQQQQQNQTEDGDLSGFTEGLNNVPSGEIDTKAATDARKNKKRTLNDKHSFRKLKDPDTKVDAMASIIGLITKRKTYFGALFPSNNDNYPKVERAFWLDGTQHEYKQALEDYRGPEENKFITIGTEADLSGCNSIEDFELNAVFTMPWGNCCHWHAYDMAKDRPDRELKLFSKADLTKKFKKNERKGVAKIKNNARPRKFQQEQPQQPQVQSVPVSDALFEPEEL
ncbi:hypothetical protein B0T22DRAFT_514051 [Podospora appendiculata]|uniref:Uncharacterized protein n=1 Tax=Podospora appendiculata TaxID=314037 RepID=A0AAE0XBR8_9PEZI|nr:hypothetical protein B0T22DRAFT_514051 [Podospora appendiculata]